MPPKGWTTNDRKVERVDSTEERKSGPVFGGLYTQTPQLAKELSQKYALSDKTALTCAQNVFRYKETHGVNPSEDQIKHMAQIAQDLETKDYSPLVKAQNPHQVEFLRRQEGDSLFHYGVSESKVLTTAVLHRQTKKLVKELESQAVQNREHANQKEFSL